MANWSPSENFSPTFNLLLFISIQNPLHIITLFTNKHQLTTSVHQINSTKNKQFYIQTIFIPRSANKTAYLRASNKKGWWHSAAKRNTIYWNILHACTLYGSKWEEYCQIVIPLGWYEKLYFLELFGLVIIWICGVVMTLWDTEVLNEGILICNLRLLYDLQIGNSCHVLGIVNIFLIFQRWQKIRCSCTVLDSRFDFRRI